MFSGTPWSSKTRGVGEQAKAGVPSRLYRSRTVSTCGDCCPREATRRALLTGRFVGDTVDKLFGWPYEPSTRSTCDLGMAKSTLAVGRSANSGGRLRVEPNQGWRTSTHSQAVLFASAPVLHVGLGNYIVFHFFPEQDLHVDLVKHYGAPFVCDL